MAHITKDKGDLAVAKAIAHLMEHDIRVCMPLSEHLPFDFIAVMPDMTTLRRVQVKYRSEKATGVIFLRFESNYYDSKHIYSKPVDLDKIDCYAVFSPTSGKIYYLNTSEIPPGSKAMNLRIAPAKNGQQKGVRLAQDYENPRRVADCPTNVFCMTRHILPEVHLAAAKVESDLLTQGWYTCSPHRWDSPFDLIAVSPDMMRLIRVRVGAGMTDTTPYADAYAMYDPASKQVRYLSANAISPVDRCVSLDTGHAMSPLLEAALAG